MIRGIGVNNDVSFLAKQLDNHIARFVYSLYDRKEMNECSQMNMKVADFLYDQKDNVIYQKDIEDEYRISKATASKMLRLMEEKQWIIRSRGETDARKRRIALTPEGEALHRVWRDIRREIETVATADIPPEEIAAYKAVSLRIIGNLQKALSE